MLFSRSLKLAVLALGPLTVGLLTAGCDRQGGDPAQPAPTSAAPTSPGAGQAAPQSGVDRSHKGSQMPAMTLADPAGRKLALASLAGKPVLVNLWATWCAPCVTELPTLEKLAASGRIRVLTVSQDSGDPARVAAFLKDKGFSRLEPWLDPANDLSFHYNTGTLPTTVLYDSRGREVWRYVGEHDWASPATAPLLAEAR